MNLLLSACLALLLGAIVNPPEAGAAGIGVHDAWARATVPGQPSAGGFLVIENSGQSDRLLAARADVARAVELHSMVMQGDTMRMRRIEAVDVPAGGAVELRPGALHLMFIGLHAPLNAGDAFALTLRFERAGEVVVQMQVMPMGHRGSGHGAHGGAAGGK
ncbi:MAG: copper chaperone PCu(A)C [Burkholderiales bacterium]|nr:MAG: copper chaperone PCu(A)C [Burkholderiales bacterium]